MSKKTIIAKLTIDPARTDDAEAALGTLIDAAAEEAGLEIYSAHKDPNEAGVYWFFEIYTDEDAVKVHGSGEGMKAAMGALGGFLTGRPEVMHLDPVVAKGLDL